ncbi:PEPxxWA-CTERM sorting domain-containing protein [Gimibacter soli]|uniref:PEPxxWA-CTERM sorting domain-containing protein n=1 Tax=Gimibacter soli TaxID=3024400 RepID=A0AAE9XRM5_9PROT|nr:PEPxxWA-CTERM sorting domain-containing protein [Gimibacter soli]WCL53946.1 PEPxxWA-CTERM sorting domain-containing protein [Gimibacter soli]
MGWLSKHLRRMGAAGAIMATVPGAAMASSVVYTFTGTADFQGNAALAAAFGYGIADPATFSARLWTDDSLVRADAFFKSEHDDTDYAARQARYSYGYFKWELGNRSWEYGPGTDAIGDLIWIFDGISDGTDNIYDFMRAQGATDLLLAGLTITLAQVNAYSLDETLISGNDMILFDQWSLLAASSVEGSMIRTDLGDVDLYNVSMVKAAGPVPEPATWLMMIMGFGLAGFAARQFPKHAGT